VELLLKRDSKKEHRMAMKIALYWLLQKVHPGSSISKKAMKELADLFFNILEAVIELAGK